MRPQKRLDPQTSPFYDLMYLILHSKLVQAQLKVLSTR